MPKRPRRPPVAAAELARLHDVDPRTVRRWARAGCPVVKGGKAGHRAPLFDEVAVVQWVERNAGQERGLVRALCHVLDARSRAAARTLAQFAVEYHPLADCLAEWNRLCRVIRARLERVPKDLLREIGVGAAAQLEAAIEEAIGDYVPKVAELAGLAKEPGEPKRPRVVRSSRTVREARAQLAEFQGEVLDVRERIAAGRAYLAARGGRIFP